MIEAFCVKHNARISDYKAVKCCWKKGCDQLRLYVRKGRRIRCSHDDPAGVEQEIDPRVEVRR